MRSRIARTGRRGASAIEVEVELEQGRAIGRIAVHEASGVKRRRIEAATCAEAVDGLALIAALSLEGAAADEPPLPAGKRLQRSPPGRPPAGESPRAADEAPARATESSPEPAATATTQDGATAPAEAPSLTEARTGATTRLAASQPTAGSEDDDAPAAVEISLFASALALAGTTPSLLPAFSVGAAAAFGDSAPVLELLLSARLSLAQRVSSVAGQGDAEFQLLGGALGVCPGLPLSERVRLLGCGLFEAASLSGEGLLTQRPRRQRRAWLAAGPATRLAYRLPSGLALHVGAEALFPFRRDRFLLGDQIVHRADAVSLRALIGLQLALD